MGVNAYTLLGQMGTFAVLVLFTMKFVWPPIMTAMQERQKKIADGLAAAERAQHDLASAQADAESELREARTKAADIVAQANQRGEEIIAQKKSDAEAEGQRALAQARAQIEQEEATAREKLRAELATLATAGASKILNKEINADTHASLLDDLAADLGKA